MKLLIQRVTEASVTVDGCMVSEIGLGYLVLIGIAPNDTQERANKLCAKLLKLRIFEDEQGAMNRSIMDVGGSILAVSQFTLYADMRHGNRPGFSTAARPEIAEPLYLYMCDHLRQTLGDARIGMGVFGADMKIRLLNDGPVTIELKLDDD